MHEVGSEFVPRDAIRSRAALLTTTRADDFRSQAVLSQRVLESRGTQSPGANTVGRPRPCFRVLGFGGTAVAPPNRSAAVRIFVRNPGSNAHDLAVASRVV